VAAGAGEEGFMKILVTGASGFIGRRLVEEFRRQGHTLVALSRDPETARRAVPGLEKAFAWNPLRDVPPAEAFGGVDAVVHLAGETVSGRWNEQKKQAIRDSRILGTANLVKTIVRLEKRPQAMVCASAIGYYGDRGDEELTEDSPPGDDFLAEVCRQWEKEAGKVEWGGVRSVCVRTGIVLGPGGGALAAMLLPFRLGAGGPLGSGRQWWSWIHRDDLIALIQFLIEHPDFSGAVNGASPGAVRQKEFAKVLGRVLWRPAFLPAPAFALKIVLGGFSSELLSSKRVLPKTAQALGFSFRYPDLQPALRQALGR
jgi:uncharacterized protein (TIGR01777 family)